MNKEVAHMSVKVVVQTEARRLRKKYPKLTVNVKEITRGNWGIRFSAKGKRDTFRTIK